jgi:calcyphosin
LTDRRLELVESVFEQLDRKRVGYVATQDVVAFHDASKHPSVMFGDRTPSQVHDEFLASFTLMTRSATSPSAAEAFVNRYQWMSYFQYVSGHVPSEEYFELVMKRVWKAAPLRTSLGEATTTPKGIAASGNGSGGVTVAPLSLLQALQDAKYSGLTVNTATLPPPAPIATATASLPPRLHRSQSLTSQDGVSPKATHTNAEFLKGTQFAACMVDLSLHTPTASPRSSRQARRTSPRPQAASSASSVEALDPGTLSVLTRLRAAIKARGLASLVELTRQIRLADANSDGLLSLAEFKQAIQQTEDTTVLQLSESDLRVLFKYLDRDHRGAIAIGTALDFIRTPLSARRLELVHFAFASLADVTGSGELLEPSDVVQHFDAARHPDVIAGRKPEAVVFQEFIESFDLDDSSGGGGKISRLQWENYYHNVGFFVPDDDYFELLLRNTWQLAHVPAPGSSNTTRNASTSASSAVDKRVLRGFTSGHNSRQTFAILQPELSDHHASVLACERHGLAHTTSPTFASPASTHSRAAQSKDLRRILHQLRAALKDQGVTGFLSLQRHFRLMDDDQNGSISLDEFTRALRAGKVLTLSSQDVQNLFHFFDANHDGAIDCHEFMLGVREPMNDRRMLFVRMAFDALDKDRNGVLEVSDLVDVYDARRHPDVLSGRKTQEDVFREFLESFDLAGLHTGSVSLDDWTRYYLNISASIDDDDYFELMMRNAWHISGGVGWCGNTTNRRLLVTHADGSSTVEEVQNDLGVKKEDASRVLAMQMKASSSSRGSGDSPFQKTRFYDVLDHTTKPAGATAGTLGGIGMVHTKNKSSGGLAACLGTDEVTGKLTTPRRGSLAPPSTTVVLNAPAGVAAIIARLKAALKAKGAHGFCGLSRSFRLMDDDGNGSLNLAEFRQAMRACSLDLHDGDVRLLFQYFDRDRSGAIDLGEFLVGVRDPMNDRRMAFVREAFSRMDTDGNGLLEPSDIVETYDASRHPDVLAGRKSSDDVFRDFLETFDVDGIHNGQITWAQWVHYYHNISASIDDDDYFELMMRNAWHISGGVGWCENTTNRRVLVTLEDGRDVVREVRDDLGVKIQDVQARLEAQDKEAAITAIATSSMVDLTQPPQRKIVSLKDASFHTPLQPASTAPTPLGLAKVSSGSSAAAGLAGDAVFYSVRRRLQQKTLADVVALRKRVLHHIDAKTGTVSAAHCAEALSSSLGILLSESHGLALLSYLHAQPQLDDGMGMNPGTATTSMGARLLHSQSQQTRISVKKLLTGVLGSLSSRNHESMSCVFAALQAAGKGRVFPVALARSFCAANHPDVQLGLVSADAVFQDFAASVEVSGASADGAVGIEQFETFCVNWRATLTSDEHLDVLLRECFSISG